MTRVNENLKTQGHVVISAIKSNAWRAGLALGIQECWCRFLSFDIFSFSPLVLLVQFFAFIQFCLKSTGAIALHSLHQH